MIDLHVSVDLLIFYWEEFIHENTKKAEVNKN